MRGLKVNPTPHLHSDLPQPIPGGDEVLIQVLLAGICRTDLEIAQGYLPFTGIIGHEFVGRVVAAPQHSHWLGKRVVGEINVPCGDCPPCQHQLPNHCLKRQAIGIHQRDGCMADFLTLPVTNLHEVPTAVSDEEAVFTEPLAAALAILEEHPVFPSQQVAVVGDGKLGLLIAQILALTGCVVTILGHHPERKAWLSFPNIHWLDNPQPQQQDMVVECSGSPQGLQTALHMVRSKGKIILKTTTHAPMTWPGNELVVREITLAGSRCGPFPPALQLLARKAVQVTPLITAIQPLQEAVAALLHSQQPGVMKILLQP
ncbi:MAG: alcohol dehydrogenase catalytic domain-containing protein [Magnetococcales bacterium]|nr:alcohol dehydrogenase catalytic domain-containing protein [Magnetococcales bacterium]